MFSEGIDKQHRAVMGWDLGNLQLQNFCSSHNLLNLFYVMVTFNMKHDFELGIIAKFCFVSKIKRIQVNFYPPRNHQKTYGFRRNKS